MAISSHSMVFSFGEDFVVFFFLMGEASIRMEATSAITPPNFDGMERRIAYANKKYHSG